MREWKNNENNIYPSKFKKLMYAFAFIGFIFLPLHLILFHKVIIQDFLDIGGGLILIWMARFGGGYKISRWWAERELRKRDNKWKYGP